MSIMTALFEPQRPSAVIPGRVNAAMSFVSMMRQTAVRPPAFDGGAVTETPQSKPETAAYAAALDCLRVFFNGEHFLDESEPPDPDETAPPPPATDPVPDPAPRPVMPAGK